MAALGAVALLSPQRQLILLFFALPIRVAAALFAAFFLLSAIADNDLSSAAHLGGLAFGFLSRRKRRSNIVVLQNAVSSGGRAAGSGDRDLARMTREQVERRRTIQNNELKFRAHGVEPFSQAELAPFL